MGIMNSAIFRLAKHGFGVAAVGSAFSMPVAFSHCQVPCGIFDDALRAKQLKEDCSTIKKAMHEVGHIAEKTDAQSLNQSVRWIMTKEEHASKIITTVAEYFMTQKMKTIPPQSDKAAYEAYLATLAAHHAVLVAAMKAKQSTDMKVAEALMDAIVNLISVGKYD